MLFLAEASPLQVELGANLFVYISLVTCEYVFFAFVFDILLNCIVVWLVFCIMYQFLIVQHFDSTALMCLCTLCRLFGYMLCGSENAFTFAHSYSLSCTE